MKRLLVLVVACMVTLLAAPSAVRAQQQEPAPMTFSQEELDQLLAPVALYPDGLLSQVLMAATYPLEAVQAARFARQNSGLRGAALADALEEQPWDASVKALIEFPSVLAMMEDQLAWTQKLGDAFLAQQEQVMDTVQSLRARAQEAGTLQSSSQQRVIVQDQFISIESTAPDVIYVPYYNPTVVYGRWWWPHRQPMVWTPPPAYRPRSYGDVIAFGVGVGIIAAIFHDARPDWRRHNFTIHDRRRPSGPGAVWNHDPGHRLGAAYRSVNTRNRFQPSSPAVGVNRENYRGRVTPSQPLFQPQHRVPVGPSNAGVPAHPAHPAHLAPPPSAQHRVSAQTHIPAPPARFNPAVVQAHPFNPAGSAQAAQWQAERGRASREASHVNRAATNAAGPRPGSGRPAPQDAPNAGRQHERKH